MNLTIDQKKAAAAIFAAAADGKTIEHRGYGQWSPANPFETAHQSNVFSNPECYRIAPDPIAPGHNPSQLTVAQVGEGWRLLDEDEYEISHSTKWWLSLERDF